MSDAATDLPSLPDGYRLVALDICGSTNDEAKALARDGAPEGTLVWAKRQEAGRGRRGRSWISSEGNLFLSLILRPGVPPARAAQLSFVAAVAVAEMVSAHVPGIVRLKWPNDVLVAGAKIAGILLESEPAPQGGPNGGIDWLVLGIGVNVAASPDLADYAATSILAAGGREASVQDILADLISRFSLWYERWLRQGFEPVRAAWLNAAQGMGETVTVRLPGESFSGRFMGLDATGEMLVAVDGGVRRVSTGDVFFA